MPKYHLCGRPNWQPIAKTIDAVWDVLDRLEEDYEYVVLLQPTSPLRLAEDITGAIQKALENGKDVVSVCKGTRIPPGFYDAPDG